MECRDQCMHGKMHVWKLSIEHVWKLSIVPVFEVWKLSMYACIHTCIRR
jgi:hypothetical protein